MTHFVAVAWHFILLSPLVPCAETPTVAATDLTENGGHRRHQVRRGYLLFFRRLPPLPPPPMYRLYTSSHPPLKLLSYALLSAAIHLAAVAAAAAVANIDQREGAYTRLAFPTDGLARIDRHRRNACANLSIAPLRCVLATTHLALVTFADAGCIQFRNLFYFSSFFFLGETSAIECIVASFIQ